MNRNIIIWGLGKEWEKYRSIIESDEILSYGYEDTIIGYADVNESKSESYEEFIQINYLNKYSPDLVLIPNGVVGELIRKNMEKLNYKYDTMTFSNYVKSKINICSKAIGYGDRVLDDAYLYKMWTGTSAKIIFEIGANYAQDANMMRLMFGAKDEDIYVFEPHPELFKYIEDRFDFNAYNVAVGDKNSEIDFFLSDFKSVNSGSSTCMPYQFTDKLKKIKVPMIRMDTFLEENQIEEIDFVKVDVEGVDYEVLSGFGKYINRIKCIQTEAEQFVRTEGQHTFEDICKLLIDSGFELVKYYNRNGVQSDSLWIRKDIIVRGAYTK